VLFVILIRFDFSSCYGVCFFLYLRINFNQLQIQSMIHLCASSMGVELSLGLRGEAEARPYGVMRPSKGSQPLVLVGTRAPTVRIH
jgi:hypothetical protein